MEVEIFHTNGTIDVRYNVNEVEFRRNGQVVLTSNNPHEIASFDEVYNSVTLYSENGMASFANGSKLHAVRD